MKQSLVSSQSQNALLEIPECTARDTSCCHKYPPGCLHQSLHLINALLSDWLTGAANELWAGVNAACDWLNWGASDWRIWHVQFDWLTERVVTLDWLLVNAAASVAIGWCGKVGGDVGDTAAVDVVVVVAGGGVVASAVDGVVVAADCERSSCVPWLTYWD